MKYRIVEGVCIALLAAFIFVITGSMGDSTRTADEVAGAVLAVTGTEGLVQQENADFRKSFGTDMSAYEGVVYYASEEIMNAREVMVVRLSPGDDGAALAEKLSAYAAEKAAVFESYDPTAFYLLDNRVLEVKGNFLFFCVGENAQAAFEAFGKAL